MKSIFFFVSVLCFSAVHLSQGTAGQPLPDPESELRQLGTTERISIKSRCQTYTDDVASYRKCIWRELGTLGIRSTTVPDTALTPRASEPPKQTPRSLPEKPIDHRVTRVQQYLKRNGYEPGPLDGVIGPKTKQALTEFAEDIGCASSSDNLRKVYTLIANGRDPVSDPSICREKEPRLAQKPGYTINSISSTGALRWKIPEVEFPSKKNSSLGTPSRLYQAVKDSVWVIIAGKELADFENYQDLKQGSAVAVSEFILLTNCHVVEGRPLILLVQGDNTIEGQLISGDLESDRCIVKTSQGGLTPVPGARRFSELTIGERGYTVGAPSGLERTLGEGIISGLRKRGTGSLIQTTAPISPGSSGGALFDISGNLLGITTFLLGEAQSLNFAIAADDYWR